MTRRPFAVLAAVAGCLVVVSTAGSATRADAPTITVTQTIAGLDDRSSGGFEPPDVVVAADVFSSCEADSAPRLGGELWIVNKAQLVAGAVNVDSTTYGPDRSLESLAPVQSLSATATEYVVSADIPSSRFVHLLAV